VPTTPYRIVSCAAHGQLQVVSVLQLKFMKLQGPKQATTRPTGTVFVVVVLLLAVVVVLLLGVLVLICVILVGVFSPVCSRIA
jgi:hypothetical protein